MNPGLLLSPHDQFRILPAFRARYRAREPAGTIETPGWVRPTWAAFPADVSEAGTDVLGRLALRDSARLLLVEESPYPGRAYRAPLRTIRSFLSGTPDSEWVFRRNDYVLPDDLSWCVAFTCETRGQSRCVLAVGALPWRAC